MAHGRHFRLEIEFVIETDVVNGLVAIAHPDAFQQVGNVYSTGSIDVEAIKDFLDMLRIQSYKSFIKSIFGTTNPVMRELEAGLFHCVSELLQVQNSLSIMIHVAKDSAEAEETGEASGQAQVAQCLDRVFNLA